MAKANLVRFNSRYVKDLSSMQGHLKYIGFRSQELEGAQRGLFNKNSSYADWKKFYEGVQNHPALQHSQTVKVHQMLISMREEDYKRYYEESGNDFQSLTRKIMKELEMKKGVPLDWVASFHQAEGHPHVHVVLKAVSDPEKDSRSVRIRMDADDIIFVRERLKSEVEYYVEQEQQFDRVQYNNLKHVDDFVHGLVYEIDKLRQEQEFHHEKELRNQIKREAQRRERDRER